MRSIVPLALALLGFVSGSQAADGAVPPPRVAVRGIYGGVPRELLQAGRSLADSGVNAVWIGSGGLSRDDIARLKKNGARVFAEFNTMHDALYLRDHPDAAPIGPDGKVAPPPDGWQGLCPTHPGYRAERMAAFRKALESFEIDGIWLDYHHAQASWEQADPNLPDTCFCPRCLAAFGRATGSTLPDRPTTELARTLLGPRRAEWTAWRCGVFTDWVREFRAIRDAVRPAALLGSFHCPWSDDERGGAIRTKLAIDLKAQAALLDVLSPMPYHARFGHAGDPAWIGREVASLGRLVGVVGTPGERLKIWPIVQLAEWGEPVPAAQVAAVLEAGAGSPATGVTVFAWGGLAKDREKLDILGRVYRSMAGGGDVAARLAAAYRPPPDQVGDLGAYRSPLVFDDGRPVRTADDWRARRAEILRAWHDAMGAWPPLIDRPKVEVAASTHRDGYTERKVRVEVAPDRTSDGYVLVPDGPGPFPAILVVYYEPETALGRGKPGYDFAARMVRRGFVSLSIGFDPRVIDVPKGVPGLQPLSYLAYVGANGYQALANLPEVDPKRVGIVGHSYGGKWAMFAACLYDKFACGAWSDPGVAFDETRRDVNYWDPWYLGWQPSPPRKPGLPGPANPRVGAYKTLVEAGHDLHELQALMAPRPFFVSGGSEDGPARWKALNHAVAVNRLLGFEDRVGMTNRPAHPPTPESNEVLDEFLVSVLKPGVAPTDPGR